MATNSTNFRTVSPVHLVIRDSMSSPSSTALSHPPQWDDYEIPQISYGGNNASTSCEWFSTIPDAGAMVGASSGVFAAASTFAEFPLLPSREREAVARAGGHRGFPPSADSFATASPFEQFLLFPAKMPELEDSPDGWSSAAANPFAATSLIEEYSVPAYELEVVDDNGNECFRLSPNAADLSTAAPTVEESPISPEDADCTNHENLRPSPDAAYQAAPVEELPRRNRSRRSGNSAGSSTVSTTSEEIGRRRRQSIRPIVIDDPGDFVATKRARNTIASRKSRQKKVERLNYLEREIVKLKEERDYWRSLALASPAA
jgi:general control protein GCN4